MATCEETSCTNLQSAICLHCNRPLCISHIVAHGAILLEEAEELCQQINEVAEHLNHIPEQIRTKHNEAIAALDTWRQKQIEKIEDQYAEKIQEIELKQDNLIELQNNLLERLATNARDPLEQMQTQKSANREIIQGIRQSLIELKQESRKLEWNSTDSSKPNASVTMKSMVINPHEINQSKLHPPQQYNSVPNRYLQHPSLNSSGFVPIVRPQSGYNQTIPSSISYYSRPIISSTTVNSQLQFPRASSPLMSSFTSLPQNPIVSTNSPIDLQNLPTHSWLKLIDFFLNVTGPHDYSLHNFLNYCPTRSVYIHNLMIVLLSFLEAWHSKRSPTVFNEHVLSYHIHTVKRYIIDEDSQRVVIAAILVYIRSCDHDETRSGQIMNILLYQFFYQKCLSKTIILDWYENDDRFNYPHIQQAKQWATSFIEYLNSTNQSKQT